MLGTLNNTSTKPDLADILRIGIDDYIMSYGNIPYKFKKVTNHICQCRTRDMGGHVYQCDTCKTKRVSFNSCRDRHCPKCQGTARTAWVAKRTSELLPVGYFHVVFTLPDSFNGINRLVIINNSICYVGYYGCEGKEGVQLPQMLFRRSDVGIFTAFNTLWENRWRTAIIPDSDS